MDKILTLLRSLNRENWKQTLFQFIKFGLVGVSNTVISYGVEMLGYYVLFKNVAWMQGVKIFVVSLLAFVISVTNSYYWNSRYVFKTEGVQTYKTHAVRYVKTFLCYSVTGLILSPVLKMALQGVGIPYWLTSMLVLVVSVPLNYVMNKLWAFKEETTSEAR